MKAGDYYNPMLLKLEEYAVRKAPHSRTPMIPVDDGKLRRMSYNCLNRGFDRQRETLPKRWTDVLLPRPGVQQILICFWGPDDRERHGFLNNPALTFSHGMISEGFCSCRAMR
jgi:hypothetical protein